MARYRVRIQLIHWYELTLTADSAKEAVTKAEALSPQRITARGKRVGAETGLADPASVQAVEAQ